MVALARAALQCASCETSVRGVMGVAKELLALGEMETSVCGAGAHLMVGDKKGRRSPHGEWRVRFVGVVRPVTIH